MKMITAMIMIMTMVFIMLTGCMSEREYMLRKKNAENAAAHPATYDVLTIKGPVTIADGAEVSAKAPTQPFQPLQVPDGIEAQRGVVRDIVTGAVIGYGLHEAGNSTSTRTSVTGEAAQ